MPFGMNKYHGAPCLNRALPRQRGNMKKPYLSIRSKLFLSLLLILLLSYSTLLFGTVKSFDAFIAKEISKDLEASLNFAQNQYFSRASQIKFALMQPALAPPVHSHIRHKDTVWLKSA